MTVELVAVGDLGSFSTAVFNESLEHGAVWSRTEEGFFCRELLKAGVDEPLEVSEAELKKASSVGSCLKLV